MFEKHIIRTMFSLLILCGVAIAAETTDVVASQLGSNKLGIVATDLLTKDNPRGEGIFVYVPKTRFSGVERRILWLVLNGEAFALNGATKGVTPDIKWPREAEPEKWSKTGLSPHMATEAIEIVFGEK